MACMTSLIEILQILIQLDDSKHWNNNGIMIACMTFQVSDLKSSFEKLLPVML